MHVLNVGFGYLLLSIDPQTIQDVQTHDRVKVFMRFMGNERCNKFSWDCSHMGESDDVYMTFKVLGLRLID
jgi:hypothetical protein